MAWTKADQRRWAAVEALVLEKPEVFAVQGWVQTSAGVSRLCYRDGYTVRSLSLGRSPSLAACVTEMLQKLQWDERSRQYMESLRRQARKGKRLALAAIDDLLDRCDEPQASEADALVADRPDDELPESFQEFREFLQSQPTGGKGVAQNAVFR